MKNRQRNPLSLIGASLLRLYLVVGALVRIVFIVMEACAGDTITAPQAIQALALGAISDLGMATLLGLPLVVIYLGLVDWKYRRKRLGWGLAAIWTAAALYVTLCHTPLNDYGGGAPAIARVFLWWKALSLTLRMALPQVRAPWRRASLYLLWSVYVALILMVGVGEYFFWEEFGVRYNFIAVDYLVYTHEVVGNIMESYSIWPLLGAVVVLTAAYVWWQSRGRVIRIAGIFRTLRVWVVQAVLLAICAVAGFGMAYGIHSIRCSDLRVEQMQQNGAYDFCYAFTHSTLDYSQFYRLIPREQCEALHSELCFKPDSVAADGGERPNIVLITVESLSADFLGRFGCTDGITPSLDSLAQRGWTFDSLYAVGNRTVRGLEALSLCLPPAPGESIVKRKQNAMGHLSVGHMLDSIGYRVQYFYGGDSYFDNMRSYFSHNGYEVIDRKQIPADSITYANIWGVADEDIYGKLLSTLEVNAASGRPFFAHLMTTSNHRPYTYPQGRIPGSPKTRRGAVAYTDWAIGRFMAQAATRPWFASTVFIIIADHCASSAGKTDLPVDRYHIPCIVYAPGRIPAEECRTLCSQIDVLPTVFARLGLPAPHGDGVDIYDSRYHPRALMATYQNLGYYSDGILTVLSPVRRVEQFDVTTAPDGTHTSTPRAAIDSLQLLRASAAYQFRNQGSIEN
jgi:phosphoglycerol transferase MdoB-like AlkP superfamily enzyme